MSSTDQLELQVLSLPPSDRERLALAAWESLAATGTWISDPRTDPDGIALAQQRDDEIESGKVSTLSHDEFRRLTGGKSV